MIWGIKDNQRIKAIPKEKAICELCNGELIAKCGEIKIWHWSHKSKIECDEWYEPESEWHINWKNEFPSEQQEIKIGKHRADIKTRSGTIIELQNSYISFGDVKAREEFYGDKMIWLLNYKTIAKNISITKWKNVVNFDWRWKPSIYTYSSNPIFIDMGDGNIFKITRKLSDSWHLGTGMLYSKEQFLNLYGDIFKKEEINNDNIQQTRT